MSPPSASQGRGEKGELDECGGVLGRLLRPGQSGRDPLSFSSSHSLRTWVGWSMRNRGEGGGGICVIEGRASGREKHGSSIRRGEGVAPGLCLYFSSTHDRTATTRKRELSRRNTQQPSYTAKDPLRHSCCCPHCSRPCDHQRRILPLPDVPDHFADNRRTCPMGEDPNTMPVTLAASAHPYASI